MFGVIKVLAVAEGVVHVRLYKEKFPERPQRVAASSLTHLGAQPIPVVLAWATSHCRAQPLIVGLLFHSRMNL